MENTSNDETTEVLVESSDALDVVHDTERSVGGDLTDDQLEAVSGGVYCRKAGGEALEYSEADKKIIAI
jgi:hypothetical protein